MNFHKATNTINGPCSPQFRTNSSSKQPQHSIEYFKQREKFYLDIIVDLTNQNKFLENQLQKYRQNGRKSQANQQNMVKNPQKMEIARAKPQELKSSSNQKIENPRNQEFEINRLKTDTSSHQCPDNWSTSAQILPKNEKNTPPKTNQNNSNIELLTTTPILPASESEKVIRQSNSSSNILSASQIAQMGDLSTKNASRRNIYVAAPCENKSTNSSQKSEINFQPMTFSNNHIVKPSINCPQEQRYPNLIGDQKSVVTSERKSVSGFYELLTTRLQQNRHRIGDSLKKQQYLAGIAVDGQRVAAKTQK